MFFEFFLATELGKTVSQLRQELTDDEFIHFAAYYEIKGKREQDAIDKARRR